MAEKDSLVALLNHPRVKERLDLGMLLGLSGSTQTDYAIGVIEATITELKKEEAFSKSSLEEMYSLWRMHGLLRKDPKYAKYFKTEQSKPRDPEDRRKNPAYKAINGF